MRGMIDCGVLMVPEHAGWMRELMEDWKDARERIALHGVQLDAPSVGASASADALRRQALALKRYDVCLLPVTLSTLGWTRTAMAVAGDTLQTPVLALAREMSAAGLQDLLSLGLDDFMRYPMCGEEFKTRLVLLAGPGKPPEACPAADAPPDEAEAQDDHEAESTGRDENANFVSREPFQSAKARIVTEFERHYISDMLLRYQGNISQAARAAHKNRRAFWQLMRKHEIVADPYRRRNRSVPGGGAMSRP
ncbi:hypothetical protein WKR98_04045 [Pigmentiphaga sp. YJ18]|uniref:hypothetical protein n=1 Tax=Pigmentiphaga sp. YJ18 TaxID=3134907 RepID=UPI0031153958